MHRACLGKLCLQTYKFKIPVHLQPSGKRKRLEFAMHLLRCIGNDSQYLPFFNRGSNRGSSPRYSGIICLSAISLHLHPSIVFPHDGAPPQWSLTSRERIKWW
ncbi:hypothetical protein NPIL_632631 [Nephila pilipes]|uniref:Uncharacterized protein n=1 Tax=Nephila pilipes TaxID=299642 RepID=A0A8X6QN97_NEPPI|nr:hypothetical protein NPIL_632631 [Nephila pilipes]